MAKYIAHAGDFTMTYEANDLWDAEIKLLELMHDYPEHGYSIQSEDKRSFTIACVRSYMEYSFNTTDGRKIIMEQIRSIKRRKDAPVVYEKEH